MPAPGPNNQVAEVELLLRSLEKLRAREGLNPRRMQGSRRAEIKRVLPTALVTELAGRHGLDEADAVLHVVRHCVLTYLEGTDKIIADVVLATRVLHELYHVAGVSPQVLEKVYSDNLGTRREWLLNHWSELHEAVASEAPPPPSDRTLRGQLETATLRLLAESLWRVRFDRIPTPDDLQSESARTAQRVSDEATVLPSGVTVLVVGGAAMDVTFRVRSLPQPETSTEAHAFDLFPGGKGLTQAVAAARLGCTVFLVAAVGDDRFGDEIVAYLRDEGVDTRYVQRIPGARTPFTGVIGFEAGQSMAVNWRNENQIRLRIEDIAPLKERILGVDCLLATYEPPADVVQYLLSDVLEGAEQRPVTVVTPAPPYPDQILSGHALGQVDYLVALEWELNHLIEGLAAEHYSVAAVAERLLQAGLGALCVPTGTACSIFSHRLGSLDVPGLPSISRDTAGARDALCVALAVRLAESTGPLNREIALWATAAMAAASGRRVPQSMPRRRQVEALLERATFRLEAQHDR